MRKIVFVLLILSRTAFSQQSAHYIEAGYFYGNILALSPDSHAFLQGHPSGFFTSYNIQNLGTEAWHAHYNYPDTGYSFSYQNLQSDILGEIYALYKHYNFYLFERLAKNKLILSTGLGLGYATHPYDKVHNNKNIAFASHLNTSSYFRLSYQRAEISPHLNLHLGLLFMHTSNSNIKSPNAGVNSWGLSLGLSYDTRTADQPLELTPKVEDTLFSEPIKLNIAFKSGVNESKIIGSGVKPFWVLSAYADKRLNRKSALQLGMEVFHTPMLKDYYNLSLTNPRIELAEPNNFLRVGAFVGHELFINKLSLETQVGYYVKYPFKYASRVYESIALKRYFNKRWFAVVRLKVHMLDAESIGFGVGIRL